MASLGLEMEGSVFVIDLKLTCFDNLKFYCFLLFCRDHLLAPCLNAVNSGRRAYSYDRTTLGHPSPFSGATSSGQPASSSGANLSDCAV